MKFKTDRIRSEYQTQLLTRNPKLSALLGILDQATQLEFNKEITVTEILRTQAEFDALYSQTPPEKRPKTSPHLTWRAADFRVKDFTDKEQEKIKAFLNGFFTYASGQGRPVCIVHTIAGNVLHGHIQCDA